MLVLKMFNSNHIAGTTVNNIKQLNIHEFRRIITFNLSRVYWKLFENTFTSIVK